MLGIACAVGGLYALVGLGFALVLRELAYLRAQERREAMTLDDIVTKVGEIGTVADSAIALLDEVAALVRANANDPAKLQAIADGIDAKKADLAASITRNTDVDPTP